MKRNPIVTNSAITSAAAMENQMPSTPSKAGKTIITMIWNTNVLKKEIIADTSPLFRAVKKEEPHTLIPIMRNARL